MIRTRVAKGRGPSSPAFAPVPIKRTGELRSLWAAAPDIEATVASIETMTLDRLRSEWATRFGRPAPRCRSKEVLRGLLAWRIQAEVYGGLSPDTTRRLRRLAEGLERVAGAGEGADSVDSDKERARVRTTPVLKPGSVLTREWRGTLHKVQVLEKGFAHAGRIYDNLSAIARHITGTRWSGPRFFGVAEQNATRAHPTGRAGS
jgi:hypothetical protein